jgi:hypothetical protein
VGEEENVYKNSPGGKMENKHGIVDVSMNFHKEKKDRKSETHCAEMEHLKPE